MIHAFHLSPPPIMIPTGTQRITRRFLFGNKKKEEPPSFPGNNKMTSERRQKLGVADDEDEYDLGVALENNTDPFITKVIAGSLIVTITALLIVAIVIPATTDYGEGVCNPLLTGGRC